MDKFVSPNELLEKGKEVMLDGKEPCSCKDWSLMVNFFAANIGHGTEQSACKLLKSMFDIPLTDKEIDNIALFQISQKKVRC